jgi:hypothetical protein
MLRFLLAPLQRRDYAPHSANVWCPQQRPLQRLYFELSRGPSLRHMIIYVMLSTMESCNSVIIRNKKAVEAHLVSTVLKQDMLARL